MIPIKVNGIQCPGLIDSGAQATAVSGAFFRKLRGVKQNSIRQEHKNLTAGNGTPMHVRQSAEIEFDIGGLKVPFRVYVIEEISYPVILGLNFLKTTHAVIDVQKDLVSFYEGLVSVPMTHTGEPMRVRTADAITIKPYHEAIFPVVLENSNVRESVLLENDPWLNHSFLVAKTLVQDMQTTGPHRTYQCRVLNPTAGTIRLPRRTPVAMATLAEAVQKVEEKPPPLEREPLPSIEEMKKILTELGISFEGTAATGKDLDNLILLLYRNRDIMATSLKDLPGCKLAYHYIDTGGHAPVRTRPYRYPPFQQREIDRQVKELEESGFVQRSQSPWASACLLVKKRSKPGEPQQFRLCVDYRKLNSVTKLTSFPLVNINEIIDTLAEAKATCWTSIDLKAGYHQMFLHPDSRSRSAFVTQSGCYVWNRVPFGLCGAVQFFQGVMTLILKDLHMNTLLCYLDDVLVMSKGLKEMEERLQVVFNRLRGASLRIHPEKCQWMTDKVVFLGHRFSPGILEPDGRKVEAVQRFQPCKNAKEIKSFLGLTSYFRRFIKNYARISAPLRDLLKKDVKFHWTPACQQSFEELKEALISEPILMLPDFSKPFWLVTDASINGLGYILGHKDEEGRFRACFYGSRALRPNEKKLPNSTIGITRDCRGNSRILHLLGRPKRILHRN